MKDISPNDLRDNIPLVAKQHDGHKTTVRVGNVVIGGDALVIIAGPCAVETEELTLDIARAVKAAGATMLRGGAFKPLTFPYRRGLMMEIGEPGLAFLRRASDETGLPVVTEVIDVRLVEKIAQYADMLQIGARNMANFPLLQEVAQAKKPVLLKRHFGASLRDWLGAAEYLYYYGNTQVVLCERGVVAPHTHEVTSRFIVDLQVVPAVREYSHLPVIVDPSHSTFKRRYVAPIACGAIAVGADGIILDVHREPEKAAVDPLQALSYQAFGDLMKTIRGLAPVLGRTA
ncbi:MAG: 3-deoxy-7-phosphoheptulonate synthase [Acidobacteria bacterium]|nr:3-deoxy-7-phosphoheptulonate synthase [Acidobacteriota bacterium]